MIDYGRAYGHRPFLEVQMDQVEIRGFNDGHVHWRWDERTVTAVRESARVCSSALVMPNTAEKRIIRNGEDVHAYETHLRSVLADNGGVGVEPLMTAYFTDDTSPELVRQLQPLIAAFKVYFCKRGVAGTTGAHDGIEDLLHPKHRPALAEIERNNIVLCIHCEIVDAYVLDREWKFIPILDALLDRYPKLRVMVEHVSDRRMLAFVAQKHREGHRIGCTITAHHPRLITDDVIGNKCRVHNHCMPCAKRPEDRVAIRDAMFAAEPWCFFGSDSAPHLQDKKECSEGCAGVFSAHVMAMTLVEDFEGSGHKDWPERLDRFTVRNMAAYYGISEGSRTIRLAKVGYEVPAQIGLIVPWMHRETLPWALDPGGSSGTSLPWKVDL